MKQGLNPRRSRGRGNLRGRHPNSGNRNHQLDSNGPEGRIRGSAAQILERYLALARDAQSAGDTVAAENLFQHAEHYYRVINVNGGNNGQHARPRSPEADDDRDAYDDGDGDDARGRFSGGGGDGWRQPRGGDGGRDDRQPRRGDDRFRQPAPDQHRQRDGGPVRVQAEAQTSEPRPVTAEAEQAEEPRRRVPQAEDPSEHRPAFLRRREPPRELVAESPRASDEGTDSIEGAAAPAEAAAAPAAAPATVEASAEVASEEEKPKPRTRRRRTTAEGEPAPRAPRRRASAKRKAESEEGEAETVEGRDLETSA